jgi:DNA mismatch repair protein MutS2
VQEGLDRLSRFLEEGLRDGERFLLVVHGHGTGALRTAIRAALAGDPRVDAYRPGGDGEGGDGVTLVRLA